MKKWVKIPDALFFQEGPGVRNTQYTSTGVKLLNVANLVDGRVDLSTSDRYISEEEAYGKYRHFLCDAGDFIVASSGIKVEYVDRKMGFIDNTMLPLCMNTSTIRFKVLNPSELNIRYFMYYLKSFQFKEQLSRYITGSAQLNYGPSHLSKMVMPLVSIDEQQEIIALLDETQVLIELRKRQLENLDDLIKARFVEMFGDPARNTQNRPTTDFINVVKMQRGFDLPVQDRQQDGDVPVFGSNGALDHHNIAKVHGGGVITGRSGTIGKVYYTEGDYWPLNTSLFSVDTHGNNIIFLAYLLMMYDLSRFIEGTGVPTLNRNKFHNKPIIDVPLEEQIAFADFV
ncbi:MAG: restriction endonuclease subunit S, partial [Clostridia bacterium]|nr:restriction endonuclease subunit S [Clostridia bacterium]